MSRIAIVSDFARAFASDADERHARIVRRRHEMWRRLAAVMRWDLGVFDSAVIRHDPALLAEARAVWIDMPLLPPEAYRRLWEDCRRAAPKARVLDAPDDVERVLSLDRYYPLLAAAGVPQPRTALVPLDGADVDAIHQPPDVRDRLGGRLASALAGAGLDPRRGLFVRGFAASLKSASRAVPGSLHDVACAVITRLRREFVVGGLALREWLDLRTVGPLPLEIRITLLNGRMLMMSYAGPFHGIDEEAHGRLAAALAEVAPRSPWLAALGRRLRRAGMPKNCVADLAFRADGAPVLIELNPVYSAGHPVPAAHAWFLTRLGTILARKARYPLPRIDLLVEAVAALGGGSARPGPEFSPIAAVI